MPRWERSRSLARTDSTLRSVMGGLSGGGDEGAYFSGQGLCRLNVRLAAACNRLTSRKSRSSPRTLRDRKSVGKGKSVPVRVDLGGRRGMKKKTHEKTKAHMHKVQKQGYPMVLEY